MVEDSRQLQPKWRAIRDATKFVYFDDEALAYHRLSGTTHLLNNSAAEIICALAAQEADIDQIMSGLTPDDSDDSPILHREDVYLMLERLEELGLIQRA